MKKFLGFLLLCGACSHSPAPSEDAYLWLEDVEGKEALEWVEKQNQESLKTLAENPNFKTLEKEALTILEAKDKIPSVGFHGKELLNFWQDDRHVRGVLRLTTLKQYKNKNVQWRTVLDIDQLAKKEKENWVFKGVECLHPEMRYCMVGLSRGGKDATTWREYDLKKKAFVKNGFNLPEAKTFLDWYDKDHLMVGTDFGPDSLTSSGYARVTKLWKRGTPLASAKVLFEGEKTDVWASPSLLTHRDHRVAVISRGIDFFNSEEYVIDEKTQEKKLFPKPAAAQLSGFFEDLLIYKLRNPWSFGGQKYTVGSIVSIPRSAAGRELKAEDVQLIFAPAANQSVSGLVDLKTKIVVSVLEDVKSRLMSVSLEKGKWQKPQTLEIKGTGNIILTSGTDQEDLFLYYYENFNQTSTLSVYDFQKGPVQLKSLPDRFDARDVQVEQRFAVSRDGTKIPYFLVYKKGIQFDGTAPTLQYGYGGFTVSRTPQYEGVTGKLWIEKGGVYAVANIRGGGEYGPAWHQAALKENRQKAYDDFIAVSEHLIETKVTSPQHLAIFGGSNGGLLVGAVMVQRPELYGAVICAVPLLDMIRYSQLLAGASWMGEYGDPTVPRYRKAILKYSPYQNVKADKKYPPVFFYTSTKDDRVHPGHARKMAAKMKEQKHEVLYYENTEGGHAASSNLKQTAKMTALRFQFLVNKIGPKAQ